MADDKPGDTQGVSLTSGLIVQILNWLLFCSVVVSAKPELHQIH